MTTAIDATDIIDWLIRNKQDEKNDAIPYLDNLLSAQIIALKEAKAIIEKLPSGWISEMDSWTK